MARGPMTALLAVLALAGYQNRDKIGEILNNLRNGEGLGDGAPAGAAPRSGGLGDLLGGSSGGGLGGLLGGLAGGGGLGSILGSTSGGNILSGGLGGLLDQFREKGLGQKAESWVNTGSNEPIESHELHQALGDDTLTELEQKTGLTRDEILSRLSKDLPQTIDALTPDGQLPQEAGAVPPAGQSGAAASRLV